MHLNCLFYKISLINTWLKLLFCFILTEKYMVGGIKKNKTDWMYFYFDFCKNGAGSPKNQKIKKFWPNVFFYTLKINP